MDSLISVFSSYILSSLTKIGPDQFFYKDVVLKIKKNKRIKEVKGSIVANWF
jgi:hypothetical protein